MIQLLSFEILEETEDTFIEIDDMNEHLEGRRLEICLGLFILEFVLEITEKVGISFSSIDSELSIDGVSSEPLKEDKTLWLEFSRG